MEVEVVTLSSDSEDGGDGPIRIPNPVLNPSWEDHRHVTRNDEELNHFNSLVPPQLELTDDIDDVDIQVVSTGASHNSPRVEVPGVRNSIIDLSTLSPHQIAGPSGSSNVGFISLPQIHYEGGGRDANGSRNHKNMDNNNRGLQDILSPQQCAFCSMEFGIGNGIILTRCRHIFCWECIVGAIAGSSQVRIDCPISSESGCGGYLLDGEIKALVSPSTFRQYLNRPFQHQLQQPISISAAAAAASAPGDFDFGPDPQFILCANPRCAAVEYLSIIRRGATEFNCYNCGFVNCLLCHRIRSADTAPSSAAAGGERCDCFNPNVESRRTNPAPATATIGNGTQISQNGKEPEDDATTIKKAKLDSQLEKDWEAKWLFVMSSVAKTGESEVAGSSSAPRNEAEMLLNISLQLEENELFIAKQEFECPICFCDAEQGEGIILKDCFHRFCRTCLSQLIQHSEGATVSCPHRVEDFTCSSTISAREIKALVSAEFFEIFLKRSITQAELSMPNSFHCKTVDCTGWWELEGEINGGFQCPLCEKQNCLKCKAVHEAVSCAQYQMQLQQDQMDIQTKELIQQKVNAGLVQRCPTCKVMIEKNGGCPHMICKFCNTNFNWKPRHNPKIDFWSGAQVPIPIKTGKRPRCVRGRGRAMGLRQGLMDMMDALGAGAPLPNQPNQVVLGQNQIDPIPGVTVGPRGGTSVTTLRKLRKINADREAALFALGQPSTNPTPNDNPLQATSSSVSLNAFGTAIAIPLSVTNPSTLSIQLNANRRTVISGVGFGQPGPNTTPSVSRLLSTPTPFNAIQPGTADSISYFSQMYPRTGGQPGLTQEDLSEMIGRVRPSQNSGTSVLPPPQRTPVNSNSNGIGIAQSQSAPNFGMPHLPPHIPWAPTGTVGGIYQFPFVDLTPLAGRSRQPIPPSTTATVGGQGNLPGGGGQVGPHLATTSTASATVTSQTLETPDQDHKWM